MFSPRTKARTQSAVFHRPSFAEASASTTSVPPPSHLVRKNTPRDIAHRPPNLKRGRSGRESVLTNTEVTNSVSPSLSSISPGRHLAPYPPHNWNAQRSKRNFTAARHVGRGSSPDGRAGPGSPKCKPSLVTNSYRSY